MRETLIKEKKWCELKTNWGVPSDHDIDMTLMNEREKQGLGRKSLKV